MIEIIERPSRRVGDSDVAALELVLEGSLPSDYRDFLLESNGGFSHEYEIEFPHWIYKTQTGLGVMTWGGLNPEKPFLDIVHVLGVISKAIPNGLLPFAEATSNHLFLISARPSDRGSVFAYDPELEGDESLRMVADSFSAFCEMLRLVRRRGQ